MSVQEAYNSWAAQYDSNINKTRDLEAVALRRTLENIDFSHCLEIGCGTGKSTEWFVKKAAHITSVDFSEEMLAKAKEKITAGNVEFIQADVTKDWTFIQKQYELVSFSLVLEHIENLDHIFKQVAAALKKDGYVYIGELHPFKQYDGSKARFDTDNGQETLECFTHNLCDFLQAAKKYGFTIIDINEYFDNDDRTSIPRILTILLQKA